MPVLIKATKRNDVIKLWLQRHNLTSFQGETTLIYFNFVREHPFNLKGGGGVIFCH